MGKAGKIIGGIIGGLVAVGAAVAVLSFVSKTGMFNNDDIKLATVQHVDYNYPSDVLSWEEVYGANSYNVSVNDKVESVKEEYYKVNLDKNVTEFTVKIQACDSTGRFATSDWSETFVITVDQQNIVNKVDRFAQSIPGGGMALQKVVAMHAVDNKLYTTGVYKYLSEYRLYTYESVYDDTITSLNDALDMGIPDSTHVDNRNLAKDYDTASSFLAREEKSEKMQELEDAGYQVSFVTSQAYELASDTVGIKGIIKASKTGETKYISYNVSMYVGDSDNERYKYTTAVKNAPLKGMIENTFVELTGDFADYAKEVEKNQKSNYVSYDLGMSY